MLAAAPEVVLAVAEDAVPLPVREEWGEVPPD